MNIQKQVTLILDDILSLNGRAFSFVPDTPLLGAIPELDSMAVVSLLIKLEEHFDFVVEDDEIEGSTFATLGALVEFVAAKLVASSAEISR